MDERDRRARDRGYRQKWKNSRSTCACSRPKVGILDGSAVCAHCLEIETRKVKRHYKPNVFALDSGDNYPLHLPRLSQPEW